MLVYNLLVNLYGLAIRQASLFNPKAKEWVAGRRHWKKNLESRIAQLPSGTRVWVHCASYGEFEQGRPLIEAIKTKYPQCIIILTFFSPSGYQAFKSWNGADLVAYLPLDTPGNAREFVRIIGPSLAVFVKYEFWLNLLAELKKQLVPTYLVSAVFKPHHPFFKWYGGVYRRSLQSYQKIFVQDSISADRLKNIGARNFEVAGDTRFDRVLKIKSTGREIPEIERFRGQHRLIVAGSTWPADEQLLLKYFSSHKDGKTKLLIVPHNLGQEYRKKTKDLLQSSGLHYCFFTENVDAKADVMVLDTMGMLSSSYRYAHCAYIGGGFNRGIHNLLEPAVYGIPVAFYGTAFDKFNEAVELVRLGAAVNVTSDGELSAAFQKFLNDDTFLSKTRRDLEKYFDINSGSTERILASISESIN